MPEKAKSKRTKAVERERLASADQAYERLKNGEALYFVRHRLFAFGDGREVSDGVVSLLIRQERAKRVDKGEKPAIVLSSPTEYAATRAKSNAEGQKRRRARLDRWKDMIERAMSDDREFVRDLLDDALQQIADEAASIFSLED